MIMAVLPQKDGAPNPKRHIHAGSAREWAMIMGVAYLEGPDLHGHGAWWRGERRRCAGAAAGNCAWVPGCPGAGARAPGLAALRACGEDDQAVDDQRGPTPAKGATPAG